MPRIKLAPLSRHSGQLKVKKQVKKPVAEPSVARTDRDTSSGLSLTQAPIPLAVPLDFDVRPLPWL
jgi:hypothetical protein